MLKRRLFAAVTALLLAAVGAVLLTSYVKRADERAMAGMETAQVLVAVSVIPEGTAAAGLTKLVETRTLPVKSITAGSLSSLDAIAGLVALVDLQPGEQLLGARFADPASLAEADEIKIPMGMQQVSVSMERARMLGDTLTPGATVGVFVSLPKEGEQPAQTHLILHKVLVTKVGEDPPSVLADAEPVDAEPVGPSAEAVVVTLAVVAADAEKVVFGAEHGRLWLSLEPGNATTKGTRVTDAGNVYK